MEKKRKPKPKKEPLKAYGYVRVSTEEQAEEGISIDAQIDKIKLFSAFKELNLIEIIVDEGRSGKDLERPGIQKLLEKVEDAQAEAVIVYKLDRLSRKTRDLLFLVEDTFAMGNTRFLSITEDIDTNSALGLFFLTLMGALAQMERQLVSERTKLALAYKKTKGEYIGHVPYGFKLNKKEELIKNEDEQKTIKTMKRWRREGKSYRVIAELLNKKQIPPRKTGTKWFDSSVWYILN